jgi:hypothetical protein
VLHRVETSCVPLTHFLIPSRSFKITPSSHPDSGRSSREVPQVTGPVATPAWSTFWSSSGFTGGGVGQAALPRSMTVVAPAVLHALQEANSRYALVGSRVRRRTISAVPRASKRSV